MKEIPLSEIATVIRSKNSGPFELTLDVFFASPEIYRTAKSRRTVSKQLVEQLYGVSEDRILDVVYFDPACAAKVTIARPVSSGSAADTDVYGAQQHMPLVDAMVPWE